MSRYTLSPAADSDIEEIVQYTLEGWGAAQLNNYMGGLTEAFRQLAELPGLGRRRSDIGVENLQSYRYRSHLIYYFRMSKSIEIARILHISRDAYSIFASMSTQAD